MASNILYLQAIPLLSHLSSLSIPCLAVISASLQIPITLLYCNSQTFQNWHPYFFFHIYKNSWLPCLVQVFHFPYLCQSLLKLYTCVYIQNINVHGVSSWQPQKFYIVSTIHSFRLMTPLVSMFGTHIFFAYAYEVFTAIHKHLKFGSNIYSNCNVITLWQCNSAA